MNGAQQYTLSIGRPPAMNGGPMTAARKAPWNGAEWSGPSGRALVTVKRLLRCPAVADRRAGPCGAAPVCSVRFRGERRVAVGIARIRGASRIAGGRCTLAARLCCDFATHQRVRRPLRSPEIAIRPRAFHTIPAARAKELQIRPGNNVCGPRLTNRPHHKVKIEELLAAGDDCHPGGRSVPKRPDPAKAGESIWTGGTGGSLRWA